jgi:DNA-directed RNA polymerase subunit RPC12/RpoP
MSEFNYSPNITIVVTRCWECKRYFGYEKTVEVRCPHCAREILSTRLDEIDALKRSNASLRGALKRGRR